MMRRDAAPSDLQYLTEENIAEIGVHVNQPSGLALVLILRLACSADRKYDDPHREDAAAGSAAGLAWCASIVSPNAQSYFVHESPSKVLISAWTFFRTTLVSSPRHQRKLRRLAQSEACV